MKSKGQQVLEGFEQWIASWVAFPAVLEGQALVCALWALHTWFVSAGRWPVTAYLHITSDGPGCGKTTLMEVLGLLSRSPRLVPTMRALSVVRDIETNREAGVTYFFDQVEALQATGKISDEQAILLNGYREGGEHRVSVGTEQKAFSTYCAKAFACIGDIAKDLQSRAIVVRLGYGVTERDWSASIMTRKGEALQLLGAARALFGNDFQWLPDWTMPATLAGREREIWTPLYSLAVALDLDGAMMARVNQAMGDFVEFKRTAEKKSYKDLARQTGDKGVDTEYAERALADMAAVMPEPGPGVSGDLATVTVLERMKTGAGPWRVFKGQGLDPMMLSALVGRFGVEVNVVREGRGRAAKQVKGYKRTEVLHALAKLREVKGQ